MGQNTNHNCAVYTHTTSGGNIVDDFCNELEDGIYCYHTVFGVSTRYAQQSRDG